MAEEDAVAGWRSQSGVTALDQAANLVEHLPRSLAAMRTVSQRLVAHYAADAEHGPVRGPRLGEVDTRYADELWSRIRELGHPLQQREPSWEQRVVGCCRDFAVLYVSMARQHGWAARMRVGYAGYFAPGWWLDHAIAEVWDERERRWRLIEPEVSDAFAAAHPFDPLDVPASLFLTGARAWLAARQGDMDPERFVVAPDLAIPYTRGWLSLRHHVVVDHAALAKAEMLLWDQWGILRGDDPLADAGLCDALAQDLAASDPLVAVVQHWARVDGIGVPEVVTSYSPVSDEPLSVDVRRTKARML